MFIKIFYKLLIGLLSCIPLMAHAMANLTVFINHHPFYLEVPKTVKEYDQGLMYRKSLAQNKGMIFVFDPKDKSRPTMWMKNTYIPLDMLFIGSDYRIQCILEQTQPLSLTLLSCNNTVLAVIELNAGDVEKFQLKKGMEIKSVSSTIN